MPLTFAPVVLAKVSTSPATKFASTYKSPPETAPKSPASSILPLRVSTVPVLTIVPSNFAPFANFNVFDEAVSLKCVVPDNIFTTPSPVIVAPASNVTPFAKLAVPSLANDAALWNVSSSNDAVAPAVFVNVS